MTAGNAMIYKVPKNPKFITNFPTVGSLLFFK